MTSEEGRPPWSRLARTARLAALPAAYAGRTALGIGKRIGGRHREPYWAGQERAVHQLRSATSSPGRGRRPWSGTSARGASGTSRTHEGGVAS